MSDFALRAKLKRHLPCHYVLLLQHPSDLEEVTSRENANLLTIKTGSIVPRKSLAQVSGVLAQGSARTLAINSMKPMLCNTKQINKQKQPVSPHPYPTNPSQPTTCTFLPSSRNCRPRSVVHLTVMHLSHRWPQNSVRREHTDSFRGYNLFTSSMQKRHPRPSFMNCPYHAPTGILTGAWLSHWQRGSQTRYPAFTSFGEREPERERAGLAVLNWANVCSPEQTSDTSTNYDSFLNWTFREREGGEIIDASFGPNFRQTRSRQHDPKCRIKSSQVNILSSPLTG